MKLIIPSSFTLLFLAVICDAAIYEIDQEDFAEYVGNTKFEVLSYDEIDQAGYDRYVPIPPAGQHSNAFYLHESVPPQYTLSKSLASSGAVIFEATYFCDTTVSEFEIRFSYPWQDHFMVLCGPSSGSIPGVWQTMMKQFNCLSAQGCNKIDLWFYGTTVSPGAIVGLQNLKLVTDGSELPTTIPTLPNTEITTDASTYLPITTEPAGQGLTCYSCADCPQIEQDTNVLQLEEYLTCVLTFFGNTVIRGGSTEEYHSGECILHNGVMDCYCHHDFCNNQNITITENTW